MIYLDNAATGGFLPRPVTEAVAEALAHPANPGRSAHEAALRALSKVTEARSELADAMGFYDPARVIFTKNCTEALNLALLGTLRRGGHVVSTVLEHNSVLRPLAELSRKGLIRFSLAEPDADGKIGVAQILPLLRPDTYLLAVTACSNVTGGGGDLEELGALCRARGILFLVDGAQAAGHFPLKMMNWGIHLLALPGHKGLLGPQGTGALLFDASVPLRPVSFGGTGTDSASVYQPSLPPEAFESGTLNLPGLSGWAAGLKFLKENRASLHRRMADLSAELYAGLREIPGLTLFSVPNSCGIFSFLLEGQTSSETADQLAREGICVRGGLHCAPKAHEFLRTTERGLVRASLSPFNTQTEIAAFLKALDRIRHN